MTLRLIFLLFFIQLCFCSVLDNEVEDCEDGIIRVPLIWKESALQVILRKNMHLDYIESLFTKYERRINDDDPIPVPLFKYLDTEFYGEVLIGHPGQKFKVVFDTAWGDSWVPSVLCPYIDPPCISRAKYDASRSSTYVKNNTPFELSLESGLLKGKLSTDLFHIGQVNITNQTFAEISQIPWRLMYEKADGVIGLAFESKSIKDVVPLFYNMLKQNVVKESIFSFYMNRDPASKKGGTIWFGGIDEKHYSGNFTDVDVLQTGLWEFQLDGITTSKSKSESFCTTTNCTAFVDTSDNTIRGPPNDIDMLNQIIGAKAFYFGRYTVPCNTAAMLPRVTFKINNRNFTLKARDYIQKMTWGPITVCLSSFRKTSLSVGDNVWALGGAFLSRYYVRFDLERMLVGFADVRL